MDGVTEIPLPGIALLPHMGRNDAQDRRVTLPHFLAGPENCLVQTAVEAVLQRDPREYSPLMLHGPSGTGKSHLALGLASAWRERHPHQAVVYTAASDFARETGDAIATHGIEDFRDRFRKSSLLIFEDIGQLAGKRAAQEELLYTVDRSVAGGKWVVLTASVAPTALSQYLPELRSRLTAGLTVPLSRPGLQTRHALLLELAGSQDIRLSKAAVRILAEGLSVTISELFGVLLRLMVVARLDDAVIDADTARRYLGEHHGRPSLSLRSISVATARHFSLRLSELRSSSRRRPVVTARAVAMYLARRLTDNSLQQIGSYFCNRDHTTVMHACQRTESLLKSDLVVQNAVEQLQQKWRVAQAMESGGGA